MSLIPNTGFELLREPNLLAPGKRPTGKVKINWLHSLAPTLVCIVPTPQNRAELIHGVMPVLSGQASISHRGLETPDTGYDDRCGYTYDFTTKPTKFTSMVGGVNTSGSSFKSRQYTFRRKGLGDDEGDEAILKRIDDSTTFFKHNDVGYPNAVFSTSDIWSDGMHHIYALGAYEESGGNISARVYLDGEVLVGGSNTPNAFSDHESVWFRSTQTALNCSPVGYGTFLYAWNRTLSHGEILDLTIDPYQFLIPA